MSEGLDKLSQMLRGKLPDDEVRQILSELKIAYRQGSVLIGGDGTESVIVTGNRNIVGNDNQVTFNYGVEPKEIVTTLTILLQEIKNLWNEQNQSRKVNASITIDQSRRYVRCWQPRNHETTIIKKWLKEKVTLIEITGFGGYGKSALVSQIFEDRSLDFLRNRIWINFSQPYSFNQIGNWLLSELNQKTFNLKIDDDIELINKLIDNLNREHILLVFDNLETLVEERRWIDDSYDRFLTKWREYGQNSRIVITSRQQHILSNAFSRSLNLRGLEPEIAIKLLERQGIHGISSDFLAFVHETDGHPLLMNFIVGFLGSNLKRDTYLL